MNSKKSLAKVCKRLTICKLRNINDDLHLFLFCILLVYFFAFSCSLSWRWRRHYLSYNWFFILLWLRPEAQCSLSDPVSLNLIFMYFGRTFNQYLRLCKRIAYDTPILHISDTFYRLLVHYVVSNATQHNLWPPIEFDKLPKGAVITEWQIKCDT